MEAQITPNNGRGSPAPYPATPHGYGRGRSHILGLHRPLSRMQQVAECSHQIGLSTGARFLYCWVRETNLRDGLTTHNAVAMHLVWCGSVHRAAGAARRRRREEQGCPPWLLARSWTKLRAALPVVLWLRILPLSRGRNAPLRLVNDIVLTLVGTPSSPSLSCRCGCSDR